MWGKDLAFIPKPGQIGSSVDFSVAFRGIVINGYLVCHIGISPGGGSLRIVIAGEARGQQEGLQYGRGSSGVVDNRVAQVENIRKIWDRSDEGAISGLVIIFCA